MSDKELNLAAIVAMCIEFESDPTWLDKHFLEQSRTLIPLLVAALRASRARVAELEMERVSMRTQIEYLHTKSERARIALDRPR